MKGLKFTVGLAFVLSLISLVGNWFLFERFQAEQTQTERLESQLVQLESRNDSLETEVAQIDQYKQEMERFRVQIKDYVNQRDALKKEVDEARHQIGRLSKRVKELESEKEGLAQQVNLGEVTDKAIIREAAKLPSPPPSPPPPVIPPPQPTPKPTTEPSKQKEKTPPSEAVTDQRPHQVLSVNRQFNFVVVNVGLRDRLKIGDTLRVEQNGKLIGRLQVEKLYENFSACLILEEVQPAKIQEGDLVRLA